MKIAVFYHAMLFAGDDPKPSFHAINVVSDAMSHLSASGLSEMADEIIIGVNDDDGLIISGLVPRKANLVLHGRRCRNECRTVVALENWLTTGNDEAFVLYFHCKGSTHPPGSPGHAGRMAWAGCMMRCLVDGWGRCVQDLASGMEAVGCHWMEPPATPDGQRYFAGTFFWARASFLRTLPPISERERIKVSGLDSADSRYEAEVWIGNGPRAPIRKDYHGPNWNPSQWTLCKTHTAK